MNMQHLSKRGIQDYGLFALSERRSNGRTWALLTSEEVSEALGITWQQTARLFSRLLLQKRVQQVRRGLYLIPGRLPIGKIWQLSSYEVLWAYMDKLKANWQITGISAFNHYGFSTQVAQRMTVLNDKLSGDIELAGCYYIFIKLPCEKLGNKISLPMAGNIEIYFSSKAKALFDAVYFSSRFGTIPEVYRWIRSVVEFEKDMSTINELIQCCMLYGNKKTIARIGFVLEKLEIKNDSLTEKFTKEKASSLVSLVPYPKGVEGERKGIIHPNWGIIENQNLLDIFSSMEVPDED
jgi:predicted transcriptional regulator of viral defense system